MNIRFRIIRVRGARELETWEGRKSGKGLGFEIVKSGKVRWP